MGNCLKRVDSLAVYKYEELGAAALSASDYPKALEAYQRALDLRMKRIEVNIKECGRIYLLIAFTYACQDDKADRALSYFHRCLDYLRVPGDNRYLAAAYFFLSVTYLRLHNYARAFKYMEDSYNIRLDVFGKEHPETVTCITGFAKIYRVQEEFDKSLEKYAEAARYIDAINKNTNTIKPAENVSGPAKDPVTKKLNGILTALYPEIPQIDYLCAEIHLIRDEVDKSSTYFKNIFEFYNGQKENEADKEKLKAQYDEYAGLVADLYEDFPELKDNLYEYTKPKVVETLNGESVKNLDKGKDEENKLLSENQATENQQEAKPAKKKGCSKNK